MWRARMLGEYTRTEYRGDDNAKESVLPHLAPPLKSRKPRRAPSGLGDAGARRFEHSSRGAGAGKGGRPWTDWSERGADGATLGLGFWPHLSFPSWSSVVLGRVAGRERGSSAAAEGARVTTRGSRAPEEIWNAPWGSEPLQGPATASASTPWSRSSLVCSGASLAARSRVRKGSRVRERLDELAYRAADLGILK